MHRIHPIGAAQKAGLRNSLHNDSPMYPAEPFKLMQSAVTRKTRKGEIIGGELCNTVEEAIKALTISAARKLFMEDKVGSPKVGTLADMVVLSGNPLKTAPDQRSRISAVETYRSGRRF